jgi:GT2 family glycosyltransferase
MTPAIACPNLTCIVPTAGRSPHLGECVHALAACREAAVLVVTEEGAELSLSDELPSSRVVTVPPGAGFARACNRGLSKIDTDYVALVNDDALVESDWCSALVAVMESDPDVASAQGTILHLDDDASIDGCGIGWNRHWQAVQIDRGSVPDYDAPTRDIFGVSGTAAVFRRSSLEQTALRPGEYFEPLLGSYYEDVELACRLRSQGFRSVHVPRARARHSGGASSVDAARWRWTRIYGNRLLVLARLWGSRFPQQLPGLWIRDNLDLARATVRLDSDRFAGIVAGWARACKRSRHFRHRGSPMLPMAELRQFQITCRKPILPT